MNFFHKYCTNHYSKKSFLIRTNAASDTLTTDFSASSPPLLPLLHKKSQQCLIFPTRKLFIRRETTYFPMDPSGAAVSRQQGSKAEPMNESNYISHLCYTYSYILPLDFFAKICFFSRLDYAGLTNLRQQKMYGNGRYVSYLYRQHHPYFEVFGRRMHTW